MRTDSPRSLDLASLFLGAVLGLGTNLITADVASWWPPLRWLAAAASWWLPGIAVAVLVWELGRRGLLRRRVVWRRDESPFPGLEAYAADRTAVYFGRDDDIAACLARLDGPAGSVARRTVPLTGPSGVGKSSLLQAGLLPRLARTRTVIGPIRPGADPFNGLAAALIDAAGSDRTGLADLASALRQEASAGRPEPDRLLAALRQVRHRSRLVLAIDQAEELFTDAAAGEGRLLWQYLQRLLAVDRTVRLVAAVRPEYLEELQQATGMPRPEPIPVDALGSARLREVLERSARAAGVRFEPGLLEQILAEATAGDALPLVNQLMQAIWPRSGSVVTWAAYEEAGRVAGSLARHADEVYSAAADRHGVAAVDALLLRLTAWDGHRLTLRAATARELGDAERAVAADLRDDRLVIDANAGQSLVLVHEVLLRRWDHLVDLAAGHTELLRARADLESTAARWSDTGRPADLLLRGAALREATTTADRLGASAHLAAMIAESDGYERRTGAYRAVAAATAALELTGKDRNQAVALARAAVTELDADPAGPALLTLWSLTSPPEVDLAAAPYSDTIRTAAWDGTDLLVVGEAGTLSRWSPQGRLLRCDLVPDGDDAVLSQDGRLLAVNGQEWMSIQTTDSLRLVDRLDCTFYEGTNGIGFAGDGSAYAEVTGDHLNIWSAAEPQAPPKRIAVGTPRFSNTPVWSPDTASIAVPGPRTIEVIDTADGSRRAAITVDHDRSMIVAWSPDSSRLATLEPFDVRVWDVTNGACVRHVRLPGPRELRQMGGVTWLPAPDTLLVHVIKHDGQAELFLLDAEGDGPMRRETVPWRSSSDSAVRAMSPIVMAPTGQVAVVGRHLVSMFHMASGKWTALPRLDLSSAWWSPDLRRVATVAGDGIAVMDLDADMPGRPASDLGLAQLRVHGSWSPDGARLAVGDDSGFVVLDPARGAALVRREHPHPDGRGMLWSPDGSLLLRLSRSKAELFETEHWTCRHAIADLADAPQRIAFAPDGRRLATAEPYAGTRIVDTLDGSMGEAIGPKEVASLAWSAGDLLAIGTGSGDVEIVDTRSGATVAECAGGDRAISVLVWHPTGRLLAGVREGSAIRLWRVSDGAPMAAFDLPMHYPYRQDTATDLRWLDGGRRLACALSDGRVLSWWLPESAEEVLAGVEEPVAPLPPEVRARYGLRL
ncbi:AAA family ATPase [Dactylosporangium sp. CS-033363]|uniref:nSTAND1 domain-containing NTPase n=1 Tax=Dactylosporangium sp. CS-033363 TaxID=3239935 RepID=UPI003D93BAD3